MPRAKRFALAPGVDVVLIAMKAALRWWALLGSASAANAGEAQLGSGWLVANAQDVDLEWILMISYFFQNSLVSPTQAATHLVF